MKYKVYPQADIINDYSKLIKLSRDEVVKLHEEWKAIQQENEILYKEFAANKQKEINEVIEVLKQKGIDPHKYKQKSFFREKNGYLTWFKNNVADAISRKYPSNTHYIYLPSIGMGTKKLGDIDIHVNRSPVTLVELYDIVTYQYKNAVKSKKKNNQLLIKSIEYATLHSIDIDDLDHESIIEVVADYAKEEYLSENVPNGTEIYLKHACYECSTYYMGEHRCSCGNRRISIVVEGDIINGFDYYPEPY